MGGGHLHQIGQQRVCLGVWALLGVRAQGAHEALLAEGERERGGREREGE